MTHLPTTDPTDGGAAPLDLLLVEDDPAHVAVLCAALEEVGLGRPRVAGTLQEAMALIGAAPPALIVTDLHLPDSRGLDTLHHLDAKAGGIPIVVLTGDAYAADLAVAAGADDAIVKHDGVVQVVGRLHRAAQRADRGQRVELGRFFDLADGLLVVFDTDGAVVRSNPAMTRRLGWSHTRLRELPVDQRLHPDDLAGALDAIRRAAGGGSVTARARHSTDDGFWRDIDWAFAGDPATGLVYAVGTDVTESVRAVKALQSSAQTDQLTGLANRMGVLSKLSARLREEQQTAVLYCDLDGFKAVNDQHGHAHGDAVLAAVAGRIATRVRANDFAGRIGGDEFVVVTTPGRGAEQLAARLVEGFVRPISISGTQDRVGMSIGIAIADPRGADVQEVLDDADRAMYEAKRAGGDTWRVHRRTD